MTQVQTDIRRINNDELVPMAKESWTVLKKYYFETVGLFVAVVIVSALASILPLIGTLISICISAFLPYILCCCLFGWAHNLPIKFVITSNENLKRYAPIAVICFILAIISNSAVAFFGANILLLSSFSLLNLFISSILNAGIYVILFKKIDGIEAIKMAFDAIIANIVPLFLSFLLFGLISIACTIALILPVFFVAFPMAFWFNYLFNKRLFGAAEPL